VRGSQHDQQGATLRRGRGPCCPPGSAAAAAVGLPQAASQRATLPHHHLLCLAELDAGACPGAPACPGSSHDVDAAAGKEAWDAAAGGVALAGKRRGVPAVRLALQGGGPRGSGAGLSETSTAM
jgi:hypothetical protein